tara:strand:- start:129 stop:332 length:204 start_codon:yes stop_codon:yes gene_type:complete
MIKVDYNTKLFTATEDENGNVSVYLKKEVREALDLDYSFSLVVEVIKGNPLDSNIGIHEDSLQQVAQ